MADYAPILSTETDPEAPLRSSLFKRLAANPLAIAEGAAGAPRVHPLGRLFILDERAVTQTPVTVTSLDPRTYISLYGFINGTGSSVQVRFSSNGGTSFTAWKTFAGTVDGFGSIELMSLRTGRGLYQAASTSGLPGDVTSATNINAIGFQVILGGAGTSYSGASIVIVGHGRAP